MSQYNTARAIERPRRVSAITLPYIAMHEALCFSVLHR